MSKESNVITSLFVTVTEFRATKACSSSDVTKTTYGANRLSKVEKEKAIMRISVSNLSEFERMKSI